MKNHPSFNTIWEDFIKPLEGSQISTITGKRSSILKVSNDGIDRQSSNDAVGSIKIEIFKKVYSILIEKNSISRDEINHLYPKRASSFIAAVFSKVDFIDYSGRPAKLSLIEK